MVQASYKTTRSALCSCNFAGAAPRGSGRCRARSRPRPPGFNGDGYDDLAVGAPSEDLGILDRAGAVSVLYGNATGLSASGSQVWQPNRPGLRGDAVHHGSFGASTASGDFDGDGFWDLAVGSPGRDGERGAVNILYGSDGGLTADGDLASTSTSTRPWRTSPGDGAEG